MKFNPGITQLPEISNYFYRGLEGMKLCCFNFKKMDFNKCYAEKTKTEKKLDSFKVDKRVASKIPCEEF